MQLVDLQQTSDFSWTKSRKLELLILDVRSLDTGSRGCVTSCRLVADWSQPLTFCSLTGMATTIASLDNILLSWRPRGAGMSKN